MSRRPIRFPDQQDEMSYGQNDPCARAQYLLYKAQRGQLGGLWRPIRLYPDAMTTMHATQLLRDLMMTNPPRGTEAR